MKGDNAEGNASILPGMCLLLPARIGLNWQAPTGSQRAFICTITTILLTILQGHTDRYIDLEQRGKKTGSDLPQYSGRGRRFLQVRKDRKCQLFLFAHHLFNSVWKHITFHWGVTPTQSSVYRNTEEWKGVLASV